MHVTRRGVVLGGASALALLKRPAWAQAGKILVLGSTAPMTTFDPHTANDMQTTFLMKNVYDALVSVSGRPPQPVPRLAQSWTVSPDGTEYTFKLDPGAKFHNNAPLTSADVKYSFDRIRRLGRGNAWMIKGIVGDDSIELVDDHTVRFHLLKPFAAFLQVLPWIQVVNSELVKANLGSDDGQTYFTTNMPGSGPFRLKRFTPSDIYEFERVADGWRKGGGNLAGAIWKVTRETATQRLMIERGDAQIVIDLNSDDIDAVTGTPGVMTIIEPEYQTFLIRMNTKSGPLTDENLRKAISYAFDYDAMLAIGGHSKLMTGPLPVGMWSADPNLSVYRKDLDKAKEYLGKSSAASGGVSLTITYLQSLDQMRRWSLVMLDSLRPLGINVEVKPIRFGELIEMAKKPDTTPDMFCIYQSAAYADPDNTAFPVYHSSQNGNWQNPTFGDPAIDALVEHGRSEVDPDKRLAIYEDFQKKIVDIAPDIFGVTESRKLAMRDSVKGYSYTPVQSQSIDLFPLSLA